MPLATLEKSAASPRGPAAELSGAQADEAFDRLARLASRLTGAPSALVALVGENRQLLLKGGVGLPEPLAHRWETPLSRSVCQHVIDAGQPLLIEDVREHSLVRENPAIQDFGLVAYAGVPLLTSAGATVGSFCVIDGRPRKWTEADLAGLQELARAAITELELRAEIAERGRLETELRESEKCYRQLFMNNPLPMWVYDPDSLAFLDVNQAAIREYGYAREAFLSMNLTDIRPEEDIPELLRARSRPRACEAFESRGNFRHRKEDGTVIHVEVSTQSLVFRGQPAAMALIHDVTQRKRTEAALCRSEERYRSLVQATSQIVWTTDAHGETVDEQPTWSAFTGQSAEEQQGVAWLDAIHPEDRADNAKVWSEALANRSPYELERRVRRHDGEYRHMRVHAVPILERDGSVREWVGAETDVTETKRAEEAKHILAEAGAVLSASLDYEKTLRSVTRLAVPTLADHCAIDLVEPNGDIARVELALAESAQQRQVKRRKLSHTPDWNSPQPAVQAIQTGSPIFVPEVSDAWLAEHVRNPEHLGMLRKLGICSVLVVPITAQGHTLGAMTLTMGESGRRFGPGDLALAEQIADRAALAIEHARMYRDSRQALRAREDILEIVSHELRNPLSAIALGLRTLLEFAPPGAWRDRERRQVESVQQIAGRMSRLVQDLEDIARIDAGHLAIRREHQPVPTLVHSAGETFRPLATERSLRIESTVAESTPAVWADGQRIAQVLTNLVGSAVQAAPASGEIQIRAEPEGEMVRISVAHDGPGIPPEHLPRLFDHRWRVRESEQGSALGLAICKGIVEAHGGRIWAENPAKGGSAFHFTLPVFDRSAHAPAPETEVSPIGSVATVHRPEVAATPAEPPAVAGRETMLEYAAQAPDSELELPVVDRLREQIASAAYVGRLQPGDRLPSIREVTQAYGAPFRAVVSAYEVLAAEGLIEARERSGVYLAAPEPPMGELVSDTAHWVVQVLAGAFEQQIRVPQLPDLIRSWSAAVSLRCACIESTVDHRTMLSVEANRQFGLETHAVPRESIPTHDSADAVNPRLLPEAVRNADLLLTTAFHAPAVGAVARALGKPMIGVTLHPAAVAAAQSQVQQGTLVVVCVDPIFGKRVRTALGVRDPNRVRVVLAHNTHAIRSIDAVEPVLLTRAAYQQLGSVDFRLLTPLSPSFSAESARALSEVVVRLNVEARRSGEHH